MPCVTWALDALIRTVEHMFFPNVGNHASGKSEWMPLMPFEAALFSSLTAVYDSSVLNKIFFGKTCLKIMSGLYKNNQVMSCPPLLPLSDIKCL